MQKPWVLGIYFLFQDQIPRLPFTVASWKRVCSKNPEWSISEHSCIRTIFSQRGPQKYHEGKTWLCQPQVCKVSFHSDQGEMILHIFQWEPGTSSPQTEGRFGKEYIALRLHVYPTPHTFLTSILLLGLLPISLRLILFLHFLKHKGLSQVL